MPLVDKNDFDHFLDVAVRDESDTDAFRRSRRRRSETASTGTSSDIRSTSDADDGSNSSCSASMASTSSPDSSESIKFSQTKDEKPAIGSSTSPSSQDDNDPSDFDAARSPTESSSTAKTSSSTSDSTSTCASSDPQSSRILELEHLVARLKFEAADYRSQSDYYRMQHRQLRVQFEDLQAFCQQLQTENEELRNSILNQEEDSNKRVGGIWPFHKEEPSFKIGPPPEPPESLAHVNFEPYTAPEQFHEEKLKAADAKIPKASYHSPAIESSSRDAAHNADCRSVASSSSEKTPKTGNTASSDEHEVYSELSLEEDQIAPCSPTVPLYGAATSSADSNKSSASWWPFPGQTKTPAFAAVDIENDEDYDLKDFRTPRPTVGDARSRLEELKRRSALAAAKERTDELRHSGHLIGMSMI